MKSTTLLDICTKELPFPKLMVSSTTAVVLFTRPQRGVVVNSGTSTYKVGYYGDDWNMSGFKDFHGSVCLEND